MLGDWAALLVFAAIAFVIPFSLLFATFALATRTSRHAGDKSIPFESGVSLTLHALKWFGLAEMVTFVVLLVVAYVYVWRRGALEWR